MFNEGYANFYDSMHDKSFNHDEVLNIIEDVLAQNFSQFSSLLDFGCGTGNGLLALKKKGAQNIIGFDPSEAMIEIARSKVPEVDLFSTFSDLKSRRFDMVLSLFDVSNYQTNFWELEEYFKQIQTVSKLGTILALDSWNLPNILSDPPKTLRRAFYHQGMFYQREVEVIPKKENVFMLRISVNHSDGQLVTQENHLIRPWSTSDLTSILEKIGFRIRNLLDAKTRNEVTNETFRFILIAVKDSLE